MLALPFRLMARPFRGYRDLVESGETPSIAIGAGRFLVVLGALVSVSATGRFAPVEAFLAMVSFSWLPVVHLISITLTARAFAPSVGWKRAFALYLQGIGPWLLLCLFFTGAVLFAPHPERPSFLLWAPALAIASIWSVLLSYALFRVGLGLARGRAGLATVCFWVSNHVLILGYFLAVGQLWPIL